MIVFAVAVGGSIGALMRYYAGVLMNLVLGNQFHYTTLLVNVVGSFLIGVFIEFISIRCGNSAEMKAFLVTGCLGAFTTFSTFSLDILKLFEAQQYVDAVIYIIASLTLSLIAVFSAVYLTRGFLG